MNIMHMFNVLTGMSALTRFSMFRLTVPENCLEHTGFVCMASLFIGTELNTVARKKLDIGVLLAKAAVHDIEEIVTGDIPRPTKYESEQSIALFERMKVKAARKVIKDLHLSPAAAKRLELLHITAKTDLTGIIVALVDLLAVVYKIWDEVIVRNNLSMVQQAIYVQDFVQRMRKKVNEAFVEEPEQAFYLGVMLNEMLSVLAVAADKQHSMVPGKTETFHDQQEQADEDDVGGYDECLDGNGSLGFQP